MRIYVDIPFKEKEAAAKILGKKYKYDNRYKCGYVESETDHDHIKHLEVKPEKSSDSLRYTSDPIMEFKIVLENAGLIIDGMPIMNGIKYRVPVAGKNRTNRSGVYCGYLDGRPAGYYINYVSDVRKNWKFEGKITGGIKYSKADIAQREYDRYVSNALSQREAATKAQKIWKEISNEVYRKKVEDIQTHPYLERKQIKLSGARFRMTKEETLVVVPIKDINAKITNLQFIGEDGSKKFLTGGKNAGSFFQMGYISLGDTIVLTEGYATGATLRQVLKKPVICSLNAGNLKSVALLLKEKYPKSNFIVAGDNDRFLPDHIGNVGKIKAEKTAASLGQDTILAIPDFTGSKGKGTDWNDFYIEHGEEQIISEMNRFGVN